MNIIDYLREIYVYDFESNKSLIEIISKHRDSTLKNTIRKLRKTSYLSTFKSDFLPLWLVTFVLSVPVAVVTKFKHKKLNQKESRQSKDSF